MYCRKCGAENPKGAKFCKKCGTPFEQRNSDEVKNDTGMQKKNRKGHFLVLGVLILLAGVLCAAFFVMKGKNPKSPEYEKYMSDAAKYMEEADYERAEDCYLEAIAIELKKVEPYIGLADLYSRQDNYDKAEEYYRKAIEIQSDEMRPYLGLSDVYAEQERYEQAEEILADAKKVVKKESEKKEIQKQMDKLQAERGDTDSEASEPAGGYLAAVENDEGKWGYVNEKGEEVIPCQYDEAYGFSSKGVAVVGMENGTDSDGNTIYKREMIDTEGRGIASLSEYSAVDEWIAPNRLLVARKTSTGDELYGFANEFGVEVMDCKYDILPFLRRKGFWGSWV